MPYKKINSVINGKLSYTKDQKDTIIASLEQTIKTFQEMIDGLEKQKQEMKDAPLREHRIGDES